MVDNIVRCTLRLNRVVFKKYRYIAESEGRSVNKSLEQHMKQRIKEFESENGEIPLVEDSDED